MQKGNKEEEEEDQSYITVEFKSSEGESAAAPMMVPQNFTTTNLEQLLNTTLQNV